MARIDAFIVLFCAVVLPAHGLLFRTQSAGVRGTLMCGNKPLAKTQVKLWDDDLGPDPDDLLGSACTDAQGRFNVSGSTSEMTNIDVYFKVYTDCNDKTLYGTVAKPCQRKIKMAVPDSYINSGSTVTKWLELGTMNMELKQKDEERDCALFERC